MGGMARSLTPGETKRLAQSIRDRVFLARRYPNARLGAEFSIELKGGKLGAKKYDLNIPMTCHNDWDVARTVARMIFYRCDPYERWAWYGWEFCAILVDVVQALMGQTAAKVLTESMRANRVRWKPKATRTATPEMIERLAAARAKARENKE
jgi:hypothetical protein